MDDRNIGDNMKKMYEKPDLKVHGKLDEITLVCGEGKVTGGSEDSYNCWTGSF
jgi:hypothetical protein